MVDDLPSAGSRGGRRVGTALFLTAIILVAVAVIAGYWPWTREPRLQSVTRSSADLTASLGSGQGRIAKYLGEATCRDCHPGESAMQRRSGHDRTLRLAERSLIIDWLDGKSVSDPKYPDIRWSFHRREKRLVVERTAGGKSESLALDYALGSGKHGVTFVAIAGEKSKLNPSGIEQRVSYLANDPRLAITPGQEGSPQLEHHGLAVLSPAFGRLMDPDQLRQCLGCHATLTSTGTRNRLETATLVPNVSCERCHGPGGDHVDAARRGETDLNMPMGGDRDPPWVQVNMCGECHRLPSSKTVSWSSIRPDNPGIVRFQGVGVSMSACYAKGLGGLRCTTCHDPHDRTSSDHSRYEATCLSCHRSAQAQKACPISPTANCVGCHMPRREVSGNGVFTDHWIRKPAPTRPDSPKSEAVKTSSIR
jgi:hypothetical protein